MEDVKITNSNKEVIASGTHLSFSTEKPLLSFKYHDKVFKFEFHFISNDSNEKNIKFKIDEPRDLLMFDLLNIQSSMGFSPKKPLKIAYYNDRDIYLLLRVSSGPNDLYQLDYTFYTEAKKNE